MSPPLVKRLAAVCVAGAALRLYGLTTQSLWSDEGVTLFQAGAPTCAEVLQRVSADTHPPLYFLLLHAWIGFLGVGEAALRFPSVLAGLATLPLFALLLCRMGLRELALPAVGLLAVSAFHVQYSQEARSHVFTALLATATVLAAWEGQRLAWWLVALTGLYFNPFFPVFWIVSSVFVRRRAQLVPHLGGQALLLLAFVPFLRTHLGGARGFESPARPGPLDALRLLQDLTFCHNYPSPQLSLQSFGPWSWLLGLVALTIGLVGFRRLWRNGNGVAALWLLSWWLGPIVLCLVLIWTVHVDLLNFKYFIVCLPAALALIAAGLTQLRNAGVMCGVLMGALNLVGWGYRNFDPLFFNQDWRAVAGGLHGRVAPSDLVVVQPQMMAFVFSYYFGQPCAVVPVNEATELDRSRLPARVWGVSMPSYHALLRTDLGDVLGPPVLESRTRSYFASEVLELRCWDIQGAAK